MKKTETKQTRIVFPGMLNDQGILFGGIALKWMDEVAYISAMRYAGMKVVTVSVEKVSFLHPVNQGSIVEITGVVTKAGRVKLTVHVEIFEQEMYSDNKKLAAEAFFVFAAVDEHQNPMKLPAGCSKNQISDSAVVESANN
ncbi:MAG: acyl-CoA thioesterase [Lentimicrobium sp.]